MEHADTNKLGLVLLAMICICVAILVIGYSIVAIKRRLRRSKYKREIAPDLITRIACHISIVPLSDALVTYINGEKACNYYVINGYDEFMTLFRYRIHEEAAQLITKNNQLIENLTKQYYETYTKP